MGCCGVSPASREQLLRHACTQDNMRTPGTNLRANNRQTLIYMTCNPSRRAPLMLIRQSTCLAALPNMATRDGSAASRVLDHTEEIRSPTYNDRSPSRSSNRLGEVAMEMTRGSESKASSASCDAGVLPDQHVTPSLTASRAAYSYFEGLHCLSATDLSGSAAHRRPQ